MPDPFNAVLKRHWLDGLFKSWASKRGLGSTPEIQESLTGLLQLEAKNRWTMEHLEKSDILKPKVVGLQPGESILDDELPDCPICEQDMIRYSNPQLPMVCFAMRVSGELVGKNLGPDGLDLRRLSQALVLFIIRDGVVNACPGRDTVFEEGDWVYVARDGSVIPDGEAAMFDMTVEGVK